MRQLKFRRRQDRIILGLAIVVILGGFWAYTQGCTSKGPTVPEPVTTQPQTPGTVAVTPTQVTPPQPGANTWTQQGVTVTIVADDWGPGSCHTNGGSRTLSIENNSDVTRYSRRTSFTDDDLVCATQKNQSGKPNMAGPEKVDPGQTIEVIYTVHPPECGSIQADDSWGPGQTIGPNAEAVFVIGDSFKSGKVCTCVPGEWTLKKEGTWGECPVAEPTIREVCYECRTNIETNGCEDREVPEKREKECGCVEWPEPKISCGDWNECHEHPSNTLEAGSSGSSTSIASFTGNTVRECAQEKECTKTWNCKDPEPYEEVRPCECECVEWDKPVITRKRDEGDWGPCEPRLAASSGGGGAECKRWREVELTITRTWNCKEPEIKTETKRESEACDCPVDDSLCHISNQGGPGDTNFNLIITPAAGHAHHSQANGFCPGDLLASNCNCRAARAAAEVCGDPAAGGFVCKDNRN